MSESVKGRVLGVGGVFFRSADPAGLGDWYAEHLGFHVEAWGDTRGTSFSPADMPPNAFTVWSAFSSSTEYFGATASASTAPPGPPTNTAPATASSKVSSATSTPTAS